jgi:hypothetical protein
MAGANGDMKTRTIKLVIAVAAFMPICSAYAVDNIQARAFAGRDVYINANKAFSYHGSAGQDVLVLEQKFSITAGADTFGGDRAVVWTKHTGPANVSVWVYVSGKIYAGRGKGTRIAGLNWETVENGQAEIIRFETAGEVFITSNSKEPADLRGEEFYSRAFSAVSAVDKGFAVDCLSLAPQHIEPAPAVEPNKVIPAAVPEPQKGPVEPQKKLIGESGPATAAFGFIERILWPLKKPQRVIQQPIPQARIRYPVNLAPVGDVEPNVEWGGAKGAEIATIIGRFYIWQRQDEQGRMLEMQADSAVVFYSQGKLSSEGAADGLQDVAAKGAIDAVYARGDVVMSEGLRTIRADEMYYNFNDKTGLAVNATLRSFDAGRGIPIYVRAARIRQLAEDKFAAENVVLTTSEFNVPQISLQASSILVTDATTIDQQAGRAGDESYDAQMRNVRLKHEDATLFYWPYMRSNLERPDVPMKSLRLGRDSIRGTTVESKWFLSRLLGLQEPQGTKGTFDLDYYGKRGVGSGVDVDYAQEERLGNITGYLIDDRGEDRLGRVDFRRNLEPPRELRGRFGWVNREFLPYNWQVTTGINYESDEHFIESYYRREFKTGPDRETYLHLKRIEDNWGLAFLGKGRINDFSDELEEFPTGEYHLTGQSIFDDKLTLYSDTQAGQFRQRIGIHNDTAINEDPFMFGSHRTELDMPLWMSGLKAVPYVAGTVGYDDRSGFTRSLVDGTNSGPFGQKTVGIAEAGLRASTEFWKVFPEVSSRLWDLDGLRHIVRPELTAAVYGESDPVVKQHDMVHIGLSQRLQTTRGTRDNQKTVDWMRLDVGGTWFDNTDPREVGSGPYRLVWNRPMTPLRLFAMPTILNGDLKQGLKRFETYGPQRNYFDADYSWQLSDTTAFLSDAYYDIQNGQFEQVNVGFSRSRWPDLTYYIGSRYLRNVQVLKEHGSNAFVFAASYVLDPRYTLVFSQQYDFDYGANVESDLTIIRRYHRVFWALTFSSDASLDSRSVMFSIWPEGVPELAMGSRRYTGLAGPGGY